MNITLYRWKAKKSKRKYGKPKVHLLNDKGKTYCQIENAYRNPELGLTKPGNAYPPELEICRNCIDLRDRPVWEPRVLLSAEC